MEKLGIEEKIKYTQKQKNMKKYYCSDLFSLAKMLKMPIYYVIYMYAILSHAFLESFMISLSSFLSSILVQFFMTVKKLHLNFLTFLSLLNLRNSGIITLVKKVKFKLHLNIDSNWWRFTITLFGRDFLSPALKQTFFCNGIFFQRNLPVVIKYFFLIWCTQRYFRYSKCKKENNLFFLLCYLSYLLNFYFIQKWKRHTQEEKSMFTVW